MRDVTLTSEITVRAVQSMGGDHMVAAAARVSTSGEAALAMADPGRAGEIGGLIDFLMRYRHGSPFEHAAMTFFVHAPAFVWWEWVRHRIGHSYNLESSRYKVLEPVFWVPRPDRPVERATEHRPSRPRLEVAGLVAHRTMVGAMQAAYESAWRSYRAMIQDGVANEVARAALPFAVYFAGWVTVNPRSLMSFLSLRTRDDAATFPSYPQAEIEEAARACEAVLAEGWPLTHAAFVRNGRVSP